MRLRLVPFLALLALFISGCAVAREEARSDDGVQEMPVPAPPMEQPTADGPSPATGPDTGGGRQDGGGQDGEVPGESPPAVAPKDRSSMVQQVHPVPGVIDPRPVPWTSAKVDRQAMTLTLTWTSGVEPCTVLSHVDVDYGDAEVVVTVFEGMGPDAAAALCVAIAVEKQTTISLEQDIGTRTLVDGAD